MDIIDCPGVGAVAVVGHQVLAAGVPAVGEDAGIITHHIIPDDGGGRLGGDGVTSPVVAVPSDVVGARSQTGHVTGLVCAFTQVDEDRNLVEIVTVRIDVPLVLIGERLGIAQGGARHAAVERGLSVPGVQIGRATVGQPHVERVVVTWVSLNEVQLGGHRLIGLVIGDGHRVIAGNVGAEGLVAAAQRMPGAVRAIYLVGVIGSGIEMELSRRPAVGIVAVVGHLRSVGAGAPSVGEDAGILALDIVIDSDFGLGAIDLVPHVGSVKRDGHLTGI